MLKEPCCVNHCILLVEVVGYSDHTFFWLKYYCMRLLYKLCILQHQFKKTCAWIGHNLHRYHGLSYLPITARRFLSTWKLVPAYWNAPPRHSQGDRRRLTDLIGRQIWGEAGVSETTTGLAGYVNGGGRMGFFRLGGWIPCPIPSPVVIIAVWIPQDRFLSLISTYEPTFFFASSTRQQLLLFRSCPGGSLCKQLEELLHPPVDSLPFQWQSRSTTTVASKNTTKTLSLS